MTDTEYCVGQIEACGSGPAEIAACLERITPKLTPYVDGIEKFSKLIRLYLAGGSKVPAVLLIRDTLSGPTIEEQKELAEKKVAEQREQSHKRFQETLDYDVENVKRVARAVFVAAGFRKHDKIIVQRKDGVERHLDLAPLDLPSCGTCHDRNPNCQEAIPKDTSCDGCDWECCGYCRRKSEDDTH